MKFLVVIALIGAAGYLFPQLYEEANGPCQALEKKILRSNSDARFTNSIVGGIGLSLTDGQLARSMAEDRYPQLPAPLNCVATYYVPKNR